VRSLLLTLTLLMALAGGSVTVVAASHDPEVASEPIRLSVSLYIVDEPEASTPSTLSSGRDVESLEMVFERMQAIWEPAGIELVIGSIARVAAPADALADLGRGDTATFLGGLYDGSIEVPDPSAVNGFYVRSLGGINGVAPAGTRVFFVTDEPSVHDERVSSHEIGHIFGLHHEPEDSDQLMFSGTNGMELADDEIAVSRYVARGMLDGLR
jgi:hypothetical protein